jgi:hypothetical protein
MLGVRAEFFLFVWLTALGCLPTALALALPCFAIGLLAKQAGCNRQPVGVHLGHPPETAQDKTCPRTTRGSDKALIRSSVALRTPPSGTTPSAKSVGKLKFGRPLADPSAAHVVRSGMDAPCHERGKCEDRLVSGWTPTGWRLEARFLCGGKESKCQPPRTGAKLIDR